MDSELLQGYSSPEKEAYLGAIASLATVDRQATEDELTYLSALSEAAGVNQHIVESAARDNTNTLVKDHLDTLKNSDLKFALITDIITFARSDGKLTQEENEKITEISSYLGITHQQTNALGSFVDKSRQLSYAENENKDKSFLDKSGLSGILKGAGIPSGSILKGLLGVAAPIIISKILRNRSNGFSNTQNNSGGLLGSVLGSSGRTNGGLLGSLLGNSPLNSGTGGLGSILGNLSGGRGYGGLGSIIGGLFQSR